MNINELENVSVSHGTHRPIDLINSFAATLHKVDEWCETPNSVYTSICKTFRLLYILEQHNQYPSQRLYERAGNDIETLMDALNNFAPEGFYFGAHHGDGSDFGFWAVDGGDDDDSF